MSSNIKLTNANGKTLSISHHDLLASDKKVMYVDSVDDLTQLSGSDNDVIVVTDKDRGGIFLYDSSKRGTNDEGTVFNGWVRQYDGAVNVKWFGAKGDGITDDTNSIISALQNADNLYIPNGVFIVSSKIESTISISGQGTLKFTTTSTWDSLLLVSDNIIIEDITIEGNKKQVGLQLGSTKYTIIRNVKVKNVYQAGINAYGARNILIEDCYIEESVNGDGTGSYGDGIYLSNVINAVVQRNEIYKFNRIGIVAEGSDSADTNSDNIKIVDNTVHYGYNQALALDGNELNTGVWVEHTSNFQIENNYIYDIDTGINQNKDKVGGIQVGGGIYKANTSTIKNNNIVLPISTKTESSDYLGFGIGLTGYSNVSNLIVDNNKVSGFYGKGVSALGGYRSLIISNNYFEKSYFSSNSHGYLVFQLDHNVGNLTIDNNIFETMTRDYSSDFACPDINFFSYTNPNMTNLFMLNTKAIVGNKFNTNDIANVYIDNCLIYNGYDSDGNIYAISGLNRYITNTELAITVNTVKYNHLFKEDGYTTRTLISNCKFKGISIYWENVKGLISITNSIFMSAYGINPNFKLFNYSGSTIVFKFSDNIIYDYDTNQGLVYTNDKDEADKIIILASNNINVSSNTNAVFKRYNYDISPKSVFENNISLASPFTNLARENILSASKIITSLPTSDPEVDGQLWNDSGTAKVSAG